MKAAFRRAKEKVYKYDEVVVAVRNATSSDPWNVPNSELAKIARATNDHSKYPKLLEMLLKRLKDVSYLLHVQKSLILIDYLLKNGNTQFIMDMRRQMNVFKKLTTYRYTDGDNRDKAGMARQKAENVIKLLNDEQLLGQERKKAERLTSIAQQSISYGEPGSSENNNTQARTYNGEPGQRGIKQQPAYGSQSSTSTTQPVDDDPFNTDNFDKVDRKNKRESVDPFGPVAKGLEEFREEQSTSSGKKKKKKHKKSHSRRNSQAVIEEGNEDPFASPFGGGNDADPFENASEGGGDDPFATDATNTEGDDPFASAPAAVTGEKRKKKKKKKKREGSVEELADPFAVAEQPPTIQGQPSFGRLDSDLFSANPTASAPAPSADEVFFGFTTTPEPQAAPQQQQSVFIEPARNAQPTHTLPRNTQQQQQRVQQSELFSLTSQFSNLDNLTSSNALNAQPPRSSGPTLGQMEQQGMPFNQFQAQPASNQAASDPFGFGMPQQQQQQPQQTSFTQGPVDFMVPSQGQSANTGFSNNYNTHANNLNNNSFGLGQNDNVFGLSLNAQQGGNGMNQRQSQSQRRKSGSTQQQGSDPFGDLGQMGFN